MNSLRQLITAGVVGGWLWLALCGNLVAQEKTEGAAPGDSSVRSDWQQRVLQRGRTNHPGPYSAQGPKYRTASRASGWQGSARTVPTAVQALEEDGELDAEQMKLTPVPADTAYDSAGMGVSGVYGHGPGCDDCVDSGGCYDDCGGCYGGQAWGGCGPGYGWWARDLSLLAGAHGFKGPPDQGRNGNFGFHEGVNFGAPLGAFRGLGYQLGLAAVHSDFSGYRAADEEVRRGDRDQVFFTAGIFRRALCGGWQGGIAFDLLHDTYYGRADLKQLRTEIAYVFPGGCREVGYLGAYGAGDDEFVFGQTSLHLEPIDMFALYYRRYFEGGGEGRLWAGFSGEGDALVGADLTVPLGRSWAIENRVNYLVPKEGRGARGGVSEEAWGLTIQLVWYPGQPAHCALNSPYRPLFGVADNSLFMSDASSH